ncbi:MAG: ABC transporter permease, partial [Pseudonocardiales bacterium]
MSTTIVTSPEPDSAQVPSGGLAPALREYVARVRGGDVGSLPAVLGLAVLVIVFSILRPSSFTNAFNFANLIHQGAAVIVIAMGLVFVLLLGEIDLSAGFTAGTSAALMGIVLTRHGWSWWASVIVCLLTGTLVGSCIGVLVARLGIPSFVVTLAAFLGLQGVMLQSIGEGGTIAIRNRVLLAVNNDNLPVWLGWTLCVAVVAIFALVTLRRLLARQASGLQTQGLAVVVAKIVTLAFLLGVVTFYLSIERSRNPAVSSIKGVPEVVALLLVLLVGLTLLLSRTAFGRHIYAVGGNTEAARRAGIN